jgi:hypothetical protein
LIKALELGIGSCGLCLTTKHKRHWILWTLFDNKAQAALDLVDFARQQSTSGTGLVVEFAKAKHKHGKAA